MDAGQSSYVVRTIASNVPCLWSADRSEGAFGGFYASSSDVSSGMIGRLFVGPRTDIRRADTVTITRPQGGPKLTIQHEAPNIYDAHKLDHKAFVGKEIRTAGR